MDKEKTLTFLGYSLVFVWILSFFEEFPYFGSFNFLWFCKISFLLLGLACLTRNSRYLLIFLGVGIIPETIWTIDFIFEAFGSTWIGATSFMFEYGESPFNFVLNLLHLLLLPTAIFISTKIPMNRSGKYTIAWLGILVIIASYFLSGLNVDINCVHNLCYPKPIGLENYAPFIVTIYILICAFVIEPAMRRILVNTPKEKLMMAAVVIGILAIVGIVTGIIQYSNTPHYVCESNSEIVCERFFMDRVENAPYLQFSVRDNDKEKCYIDWMIDDSFYGRQDISLEDSAKHITVYLPNFESGKRKITSELTCE